MEGDFPFIHNPVDVTTLGYFPVSSFGYFLIHAAVGVEFQSIQTSEILHISRNFFTEKDGSQNFFLEVNEYSFIIRKLFTTQRLRIAKSIGKTGNESMASIIRITVNGVEQEHLIPDLMLLVDFLRERLGLTGTKQGCDGGECGACTVLVNGKHRLSCITLAKSVSEKSVETIESVYAVGRLSRLQRAFHEKLGT